MKKLITEKAEEKQFIGTVLEETTTYMIVEPNEDEEERKSSDKICINYGTDHMDYLYGVGRKVLITYKGIIKETYPAQIDSNNISTDGYPDFILSVEKASNKKLNKILNNKDLYKYNSEYDLYYYGLKSVNVRVDGEELTLEEALNHPTWKMGKKITIDSSTLANKGLEVIEASFLFNFKPEDISVTVHRQSVVHSMIRTKEGAVYAQMSPPDMTLPIIAALSDGKVKLENVVSPLSFDNLTLTFEKPDTKRFPLLALAYKALEIGGSATIAYNAADEVAVNAFMEGTIPYSRISQIVEKTLLNEAFTEKVCNYKETMEKDRIAREIAKSAI